MVLRTEVSGDHFGNLTIAEYQMLLGCTHRSGGSPSSLLNYLPCAQNLLRGKRWNCSCRTASQNLHGKINNFGRSSLVYH
jgi:hypothetical protein